MSGKARIAVRNEAMRIAGKRVSTGEVIEVRNPFDNTVVGTVPAAVEAATRNADPLRRASRTLTRSA